MSNGYVSLETLKGGAAIESVNFLLSDVFENIQDPNTDPTATRKVKLELVFKPGKNRDMGVVIIKSKAELAPQAPIESTVNFGRDKDGLAVAAENAALDPARHTLPGVEDPNADFKPAGATTSENVTPFKAAVN